MRPKYLRNSLRGDVLATRIANYTDDCITRRVRATAENLANWVLVRQEGARERIVNDRYPCCIRAILH